MKRIIFACLGLLSAAAMASPVAIPDTPAGHVLSAWLNAINSGDSAKIQNYIDTYHRQSKPQNYLYLRQITGDLSVLKVEKNDPNEISVILDEAKADDVLRAQYKTDPSDPAKIIFSEISGTDRPADLAIPRLSQAEALKGLNERADALVAQDKFSGAMLAESHGKIVFEKAWGLADREAKIPLTTNDKFRMGSMNKMFTAVSVLQLVAKGRQSLEGTVGQYVPDYPNKEIASKVTIRMLMTHTGGTGDIFTGEFTKHRLELKTNADYVKLYGKRAPEFPPGTDSNYSNYGFVLLGYIVEKVSGEDYYDYVRKHIFVPSGMTDSGSLPEDVNVPRRVKGYTQKDGTWVSNSGTLPYRGMAAGGGYSTLGDLLRFAHALMDGKLLPDSLRDAATRSETKGDWYGYGFEIHGEGLAHSYGHTGGAPGMSAELRIYPEAKTVVISLSNLDPPMVLVSYYADRMPLRP